ncbi:MAG: inositol monophosphatase [Anaerolineae bacterium]|nr:inositol monophosphatase [Anaerolineae bacterium]
MYDVDLISSIATSAGDVAMRYYRHVKPTWKENLTYVTDADVAVQAYLKQALDKYFPEDGLVGEENDLRKQPRSGQRFWILDPIDGTAAFTSGFPVWGIAIGLIDHGQPCGGCFYMPATGDLFITTPDGQVLRNGETTRIKQPEPLHRESVLLTISRFHREFTIDPSYTGKVRCLGSAIAHLCYAATGSADAALAGTAGYIWDIAAALPMLALNDGEWRYLNNTPVDIQDLISGNPIPYPLLAGHPKTVQAYQQILHQKDRL